MKISILRTFIFRLVALMGMVLPLTLTAADQQFAIAQFDSGRGLKIVVVLGFKAAECQKLISTFEASLKLDCPACKRDYGACTTNLDAYRPVWFNQQFFAPYLSSGNHRYIYSGVPRSEANLICQETAARFRAIGKEAQCVM